MPPHFILALLNQAVLFSSARSPPEALRGMPRNTAGAQSRGCPGRHGLSARHTPPCSWSTWQLPLLQSVLLPTLLHSGVSGSPPIPAVCQLPVAAWNRENAKQAVSGCHTCTPLLRSQSSHHPALLNLCESRESIPSVHVPSSFSNPPGLVSL